MVDLSVGQERGGVVPQDAGLNRQPSPRELHSAAADLALAQNITMSIATAEDCEAAIREVLSGMSDTNECWDYAEAWLPDPASTHMKLQVTWSRAGSAAPEATIECRLPSTIGTDYADRVRATGRADWIDDSGLAFPLKAAEEVVAVLLLRATHGVLHDDGLLRRIESLSSQLGVALERKRSEDTRVASEHRFHEFIDHMPAMVYMKGIDGRLLLHNRRAAQLWNIDEQNAEEIVLHDPTDDDTDVPLHATNAARANDASVAASAAAHTFLETAVLADGMHWYSSIKFPVFDAAGDVYGVGAITRDITDRRKVDEELSEAYRQLERRALHDSLTGLPNRAQLLERLASLDHNRARSTALLFLDLDDFKDVNDTYGHAEGDELLRMAAARMRNCIRPGDVLARLGGDEFAVLLEGGDTVAAESLARRLVEVMNAPFAIGGQESRVTASVGIAVGSVAETEPDELLRCADMAMYEAKSRGKGRFASFDAAMSEAFELRTRTESELRDAIYGDGLELHYQPIIDLATGAMVGVEALVRWLHPTRGLLTPDEFIPLAERTGLVVALGAWVLRDACRQASEWQAARPDGHTLYVSINVSARQLDDPVFVTTVSEVLEGSGLDPADLCLEITETAVMANLSGAQQAVLPLQDLGIELAIDDFGTGYASLTYLRRLNADAVKIDRSFVDGLGREQEDTMIVSAVIGLAHAMGLSVTAEGIETTEQMLILRDMGCQQAQGYLICPPLPADELTRQLERNWLDDPSHHPSPRSTHTAADSDRIRVVVVDQDEHDRRHVRRVLEASGHFEVVGEAADGVGAVTLAGTRQPHLVLLDLHITTLEGLATLPRILLAAPETRVVLLSGDGAPGSLARAFSIGAIGYYDKNVEDLADALRTLATATP